MRLLLVVAAIAAIGTSNALPSAPIHTGAPMRLRGAGPAQLSLKAVSQITCGYTAIEGTAGLLFPDETARAHGLPRDLTAMERMAHIGNAAHYLAITALLFFTARGEPIHIGVGWANFILSSYWVYAAMHQKFGAKSIGMKKEVALAVAAVEGVLAVLALNEGCGEMDIDNVIMASGLFKLVLSLVSMFAPQKALETLGIKNASPFSTFMLHNISVLGMCIAAFTLLYDDIPAHAVTVGLGIGAVGTAYNGLIQRHKLIGTQNDAVFYASALGVAALAYMAYQHW